MGDDHRPRPPRHRIDLKRRLPRTAQIALALTVAAAVALAAWWHGRGTPPPEWVVEWLVPALGWGWLVLAAVALVRWWRRRWRQRAE